MVAVVLAHVHFPQILAFLLLTPQATITVFTVQEDSRGKHKFSVFDTTPVFQGFSLFCFDNILSYWRGKQLFPTETKSHGVGKALYVLQGEVHRGINWGCVIGRVLSGCIDWLSFLIHFNLPCLVCFFLVPYWPLLNSFSVFKYLLFQNSSSPKKCLSFLSKYDLVFSWSSYENSPLILPRLSFFPLILHHWLVLELKRL